MRLTALVLVPAVLALAACEPAEPVPDPPRTGVACGADGLQALAGQPASVLAALTLPAPVRVIRPGTAVTMDYSETRLNIEIDRRERIVRVFCG